MSDPFKFDFFLPAGENERFVGESPEQLIGTEFELKLLDGEIMVTVLEAKIQDEPHGIVLTVEENQTKQI